MRVVKMLVLCGVAALMCCFAAVGSAWATRGPLWGFCDNNQVPNGLLNAHCEIGSSGNYEAKLLQSGESLLFLGLSLGSQTLKGKSAKETILCSALHAHGYAEGGDPGKGGATLVYTGCTVPNLAGCDVVSQGQAAGSGVIETKPLVTELVWLTQAAAEKLNAAETGALFRPQQAGGAFVELLLTALSGGSCALPSGQLIPIKGEVIGENLFAAQRLLLHTVTFPASGAITEYWLDLNPSKASSHTITRINIDGVNATYIGEVSVDVALLGHFGEWLAGWVCP
jgi:hypothetical protein